MTIGVSIVGDEMLGTSSGERDTGYGKPFAGVWTSAGEKGVQAKSALSDGLVVIARFPVWAIAIPRVGGDNVPRPEGPKGESIAG